MLRLAAIALVLLALSAAALFVPLRGRTVADRWRAARGVASFVTSAWQELAGTEPAENYTPAERRALERLLSERGR